MTTGKPRGGFFHPLPPGSFIRDQLSGGSEWWGQELYTTYKQTMQAIPLARKKGKRHAPNPTSFRITLYMLRRLGLIEYVMTPEGEIAGDIPFDKGGVNLKPELAKTRKFHAVMSRINDPAWGNIKAAYIALL